MGNERILCDWIIKGAMVLRSQECILQQDVLHGIPQVDAVDVYVRCTLCGYTLGERCTGTISNSDLTGGDEQLFGPQNPRIVPPKNTTPQE